MKLNLGSGGKPLEGYLSVDLVAEREGAKTDIVADVLDLHMIDDNSCDEVMTLHLIEHLEFWDVPKALKEWFRVLKPGGKIVIECPNLIKCCINMLQAETTQTQVLIAKGGLWGIYGDPAYGEARMMHRSGWMPGTLAHELVKAGFVDHKLMDAQTHWPKGRDMRMEAYKPGATA